MTLLLAAVGATVTALLELTIGPYLRVGNAEPHIVLVVGIVVTLAVGIEAGEQLCISYGENWWKTRGQEMP